MYWSKDNIDAIFSKLDQTLNDAQLKVHQIDEVLITGGTAHIPQVKSELLKRFSPNKLK